MVLYRQLAGAHGEAPWWDRVHVYWSDERYVPADHSDSNVRAAREALLDRVGILPAHVHGPDTSSADPRVAAARYDGVVRDAGTMDLVLLGLGGDGHVASLFPGSETLRETERLVVAVTDSPKPPPTRLTMTPAAFERARAVWFLVVGEAKREALAWSLAPGSDGPAARVRPAGGSAVWWVDQAVAAGL